MSASANLGNLAAIIAAKKMDIAEEIIREQNAVVLDAAVEPCEHGIALAVKTVEFGNVRPANHQYLGTGEHLLAVNAPRNQGTMPLPVPSPIKEKYRAFYFSALQRGNLHVPQHASSLDTFTLATGAITAQERDRLIACAFLPHKASPRCVLVSPEEQHTFPGYIEREDVFVFKMATTAAAALHSSCEMPPRCTRSNQLIPFCQSMSKRSNGTVARRVFPIIVAPELITAPADAKHPLWCLTDGSVLSPATEPK